MKYPTLIRSSIAAAVWLALTAHCASAAFVPEDDLVGYIAAPDMTKYDVTSGNELMFVPDYDRLTWTGNLHAWPVSAVGVANKISDFWSAGAAYQVELQNYDTGRKIATMKSDGTNIAFRWADLSAIQQTAITTDAAKGVAYVNYLRGDKTNESPAGLGWRPRASVLGDIIHSRPLFFDAAAPTVFVGANDGMLHAFNASTGQERFAYVPSMLIPKLNKLNVNPYIHTYYVDGAINVGRISGTSTSILVGALGAGGKGLYALDVTNPAPASEAAAATMVKWEITNTSINNVASTVYANLGYTYGESLISKGNHGGAIILMPNGYGNTGNGHATLFVINPNNGALIREIDTGSGTNNGLSSVAAVDTDLNGTIDYVYGGDLDGQLWKFDLTNSSPGSWTATKLFTTSPVQPITAAVAVSGHPNGGYMITFGTGKLLSTADKTDNSVHWIYGFWDGAPVANTTFVTQSYTAATWGSGAKRVRVATANPLDWASGGNRGWKAALPAGERVLGDRAFIASKRFYFTGNNPTLTHIAPTPDGDNWLMEVNYLTGGSTLVPVFDLNGDFSFTDSDRVQSAGVPVPGAPGIPIGKFENEGVTSQPILLALASLSTTYVNQNSDFVFTPPPAGPSGLNGGHFDFDIYHTQPCVAPPYPTTSKNGCASNTHVHQYSDIYLTTGVNMLNPSSAAHRLSNAIPSLATQFKVLVANQTLSPAVWYSFGGSAWTSINGYQTSAGLTMASLPTYTRANVTSMVWTMPVDALSTKDWAGDGIPRAGLVPAVTGCVRANDAGILGTWRNGALTVQVVQAATADADVQLNVAGKPKYGYRLKGSSMSKLLAEYTIFWHSSGVCTHQAGWNPAPLPLSAAPIVPATGPLPPGDPEATIFSGGGKFLVSVTTKTAGFVTTTVNLYSDYSTITQEETVNPDGTVTVTRVVKDPAGKVVSSTTEIKAGATNGGQDQSRRPKTGRVSWRELQRQ